MSIKPEIKALIADYRNLSQRLHDLRIRKMKTLEEVSFDTRIPAHLIDAQETGLQHVNLSVVYQLAKYYGKKVRIDLVDDGV